MQLSSVLLRFQDTIKITIYQQAGFRSEGCEKKAFTRFVPARTMAVRPLVIKLRCSVPCFFIYIYI